MHTHSTCNTIVPITSSQRLWKFEDKRVGFGNKWEDHLIFPEMYEKLNPFRYVLIILKNGAILTKLQIKTLGEIRWRFFLFGFFLQDSLIVEECTSFHYQYFKIQYRHTLVHLVISTPPESPYKICFFDKIVKG